VLRTLASEQAAVAFVGPLVERRLVACGTLLPGARVRATAVRRVANGREVVTLPDTTRGQVAALAGAFGDLHPYVVPVLRALPVAAARAPYAAWVPNELAHATGAPESDEPKPA
jgi:periplasmic divalent cation tolerance protein